MLLSNHPFTRLSAYPVTVRDNGKNPGLVPSSTPPLIPMCQWINNLACILQR